MALWRQGDRDERRAPQDRPIAGPRGNPPGLRPRPPLRFDGEGPGGPQVATTAITAAIPTTKPLEPPATKATTATATAATATAIASETTAPRIRAYEVAVEIRPGRGATLSYDAEAGDRIRIQLRGYHWSIRDMPERIKVVISYGDGTIIAELVGCEIDHEFVAEGGTVSIFIGNPYALGHIPNKYVRGSITITSA